MTKQSDESLRLTDKSCNGNFDVAEGFQHGVSQERDMSRSEAVNCSEETVVEEEFEARQYLENTTDKDTAKFIGQSVVKKKVWEVFEGEHGSE